MKRQQVCEETFSDCLRQFGGRAATPTTKLPACLKNGQYVVGHTRCVQLYYYHHRAMYVGVNCTLQPIEMDDPTCPGYLVCGIAHFFCYLISNKKKVL